MSSQADEIWNEILTLAQEMGLFEPRLAELSNQLESLKNGNVVSAQWLTTVEKHLEGEAVVEIGYHLNRIAGIKFNEGKMEDAKRVCDASFEFYRIALGVDHPDTKVIANNLKELVRQMGKATLPKLKKFKPKGHL